MILRLWQCVNTRPDPFSLQDLTLSPCGGRVGRRQNLTRDAFGVWLVQRPAGTVVAMEALSDTHSCGRKLGVLRFSFNTMTSKRLKAQGKSIKRAVLTGSPLRNC